MNNLRHAYDITLMTQSEEELRSLLMKVKEEREKAGLKFNIQNTKIMASVPAPCTFRELAWARGFQAAPWQAQAAPTGWEGAEPT